MFEKLIAYLSQTIPLTERDCEIIEEVFLPKKLMKGEFLLREGEVAKYGAFVSSGLMRSYLIDQKGKEHIVQFAPENWWISEKGSAFDGSPSSIYIDAIEDSELLLIDQAGHFTMLEKVKAYSASFQAGIEKRGVAKDKRIMNALSTTAEERYADFLETYPTIAARVPQHMLASYLGITPETLSRIRRKSMRKK